MAKKSNLGAQIHSGPLLQWRLASLIVLIGSIIALGVFALHDPTPKLARGQDSWEHLGAFALLATLVLAMRGDWLVRVILLLEAVALVEIIQGLFIPTRSASWSDAGFGALGVAMGCLCAPLLARALKHAAPKIAKVE